MITRVGIVGCGYGATVLVPAFLADHRVQVAAISAGSGRHAGATAKALGVPLFLEDWRDMLDPQHLDAIAVAVPPGAQEEIINAALQCGLHVFAEKPLAITLEGAESLAHIAHEAGLAHAIDFNFRKISAMRAGRDLLRSGVVGPIRHIAVAWQVESFANKNRFKSWKSDQSLGGGALFNFVSHSLDYLEWFMGPIIGLSGRLAGMPGDMRVNDTFVTIALQFASGAAGSFVMSAAAYRGSGHRLEFYGEEGTLVLENPGPDYMRGFELRMAQRPDEFRAVEIVETQEDAWQDGRVLPCSQIVRGFVDWINGGSPAEPNFWTGSRVQYLLESVRRSSVTGQWITIAPQDYK